MLNKGGGSNRLPGLVTKQQAVEFPQVQTSIDNYYRVLHVLQNLYKAHNIVLDNSNYWIIQIFGGHFPSTLYMQWSIIIRTFSFNVMMNVDMAQIKGKTDDQD